MPGKPSPTSMNQHTLSRAPLAMYLNLGCKLTKLQLVDPLAVYIRPSTLQIGGTRSIPPFHHANFSSSLLTPYNICSSSIANH
jgi:hypothetical protein